MKQLLPLLIFLCTAWGLHAQNLPLTVSGTVTNTDGDPVEGVSIQLFTDSLSNVFIYYNAVTTDAQGQYSDTFDVPGNFTQGILYVVMTDCNGFQALESVTWNPGNTDVTVDFTYCDVQDFCNVYISETASGQLWANPTGVAPYTYQWNTGDTTQSIAPSTFGVYCVTVADAAGCTAVSCFDFGTPIDTSCYAYISLESTTGAGLLLEAVGSGTPPFSYVWSTGEAASSIVASSSGVYCVTLTDSQGCIAITCADAIVEPCSADIQVDSSSLTALADGEAPFTYAWNTGSAAPTITPDADGQYCVSITDADGCQASACYYWSTAIDTSCYVTILSVQGGTMLEAVADGTPPFTYTWNTGDDTPVIFITAAGGAYCVTVTDAGGCQSSACAAVPPTENYRVQGYVYLPDSTSGRPLEGEVYLIAYNAGAGTLTAMDTATISSFAFGAGSYDFGDVPAGEYLIKAALSPGSNGYADHLPTYYGNSLWWDEATTATAPFSGMGIFNIILVEGDNPGGPGFIGGLVTDGANLGSEPIEGRGGNPIAGASIILLNEFGQPVTYTYTDGAGAFEFPSLSWGTYEVVLELPGHEQASYMVTLGPDNAAVHGLMFEVTEAGILNVDVEEVSARLTLFPVPAREQLTVQFEAQSQGRATLLISDYTGRVLYQQAAGVLPGVQRYQLDISPLPAGLYTLGVRTAEGLTGKTFIKE